MKDRCAGTCLDNILTSTIDFHTFASICKEYHTRRLTSVEILKIIKRIRPYWNAYLIKRSSFEAGDDMEGMPQIIVHIDGDRVQFLSPRNAGYMPDSGRAYTADDMYSAEMALTESTLY